MKYPHNIRFWRQSYEHLIPRFDVFEYTGMYGRFLAFRSRRTGAIMCKLPEQLNTDGFTPFIQDGGCETSPGTMRVDKFALIC